MEMSEDSEDWKVPGAHMIIKCDELIPSVNGNNWSIVYQPRDWLIIRDIKYGNKKWVAVGRGTLTQENTERHNVILVSDNGVDWNKGNVSYNYETSYSGEGEMFEGYSVDYNGTCWLMTGKLTIYSRQQTDVPIILRSYDGINWDPVFGINEVGEHTFYKIKWLNNRWVAVGRIMYGNEYVHIMKSDDINGTNWTKLSWLNIDNENYTVPHFLSGSGGEIYIMSSDKPGKVYMRMNNDLYEEWNIYNVCPLDNKIRDFKYINNKYYVVGEKTNNPSTPIAYSADVTYDWVLNKCESIECVGNAINGHGNVLILGGETGKLAYSTNSGNSWTNILLPSDVELKSVRAIYCRTD